MKVFLCGGAGFIGAEISRQLLRLGHEVIIFDAFLDFIGPMHSNYQHYLKKRMEDIKDHNQVKIIKGDVRNAGELSRALKETEPDKVVFLAALPIATVSNKEPETAASILSNGLINCLEAVRRFPSVNQFIYTSSSMVYGDFVYTPADEEHPTNPKDIYGGLKLAGELITKVYGTQYGLKYTIIRPSAVYGPTDVNKRVTQLFLENAFADKSLTLHNGGESKLDFTYVEDTAQGFVKALLSPNAIGQTFNITRGEGRSLKELAEIIRKHVPSTQIEYKEAPKDEKRPERGALSIEKAKKLLGYEPTHHLELGMEKYVQFMNLHGTHLIKKN